MTRGHTTSVWDAYGAIHCGTLAVCCYSLCNTDRIGIHTEKCINCGTLCVRCHMLVLTQRNVSTVVYLDSQQITYISQHCGLVQCLASFESEKEHCIL